MGTADKSTTVGTVLNIISEMTFFDTFEPQELDIISRHLSYREIEKDEVVFNEGEKGNYMCFVAEGSLNVAKDVDGKKNVVISMITRGKSFGEMAMVDLSPRSATVIGSKKTVLIIMGRQAFDLVLERHPKIGVKLLSGVARLLSLYLRQASGRLADKIATR
ncbi:MAG: cyclic nucleotide-binding domain-containing protein [Gammaproteobacteria bacterium]|nr:cyclic nucleotide-binding domain-containing protein [Gammaproteobacteria bacterium]